MQNIVERKVSFDGHNTIVSNIKTLSLPDTLDCGQAFRWSQLPDGSWKGVVGKRSARVSFSDGKMVIYDTKPDEYENLWRGYFDLDRDYSSLLLSVSSDPVLKKAQDACPGIRVLRQEPWETLCSFIISQNNNIKRIKIIIERLCETFGEPVGETDFSFPPAAVLCEMTVDDLAPLRAGFRAKYIIDAASKVVSGEIDFDRIDKSDTDTARAELMRINGVGPKVADCTLLFGFGKIDAFPQDVWIKRAMATLFADGLPDCAKPYAGIVQQYIFHYARTVGLEK